MYKIPTIDLDEIAGNEVIIYGASIGGRIASEILDQQGVSYHICDRKKKGTVFRDKMVEDPGIIGEHGNAKVLIAGTRSFDSQCAYAEKTGNKNIYNICHLLDLYHENDEELTTFEKIATEDFINKYRIYSSKNDDNILLHTLDVIITERCTLKCRDCSAMMPSYCNPKIYNVDDIICNIEKVLNEVEKIVELVIVGGEPLTHRELYRLLEWGNRENKICNITIISNATVIPDKNLWKQLTGTKSRLRLSDYGSLSIHKEEIIRMAEEKKANCFVQKLDEWQDMGKPVYRSYSKIEQEELFKDCPFAYSTFLLGSKLFRCGHAAHLYNLGIVSDAGDYIDFNDGVDKEKIKNYMDGLTALEACGYCSGVGIDKRGIEQAIQTDGRRPIYENK